MNNKEFFDLFDDSEEYPENVAERGVPQNTVYHYISTTFLNGLINYVDNKMAIMIERYTEFDDNDISEYTAHLKDNIHSNYSGSVFRNVIDDVVIFGETEDSYWYFYSDGDCSDSDIGRVEKDRVGSLEEFKKLYIESLKSNGYYSGKYIELPKPSGWVTL